jgi:hypothetical protein
LDIDTTTDEPKQSYKKIVEYLDKYNAQWSEFLD